MQKQKTLLQIANTDYNGAVMFYNARNIDEINGDMAAYHMQQAIEKL